RRTWFPLCGVAIFGLLAGGSAFGQDKPTEKPNEPKPPAEIPVARAAPKGQIARPAAVAATMRAQNVELTKAIAIAEKHTKGNAIAAVGDVRDDELFIKVHCVVGEKCMLCVIEPDGKVKGSTEAPAEDTKRLLNGN